MASETYTSVQYHGHSHSHEHGHSHGHDYAQANEAHFNELAHYHEQSQGMNEFFDRLGVIVREIYEFKEDETSVLDFACGIGMFSRQLAPYSKSIVGIDISQNAVNEYNRRVGNQGLIPEEMQAIRVELKGEEGELDGRKFDVVVCSMSYHHFDDVAEKTHMLAFFLQFGGSLIICDYLMSSNGEGGDLMSSNGEGGDDVSKDEKYSQLVPHRHGFSEESMRRTMEGAGLVEFSFRKAFSARHRGSSVDIFVAKATKPSSEAWISNSA
ncbi:S-adenosyl-L-methionine-dependent methyltransferase [Amylostereum chailletii]|nr:S-adenosyl-L-methionine-dependent methyltransferase [Amylostereum chailletii]